MLLSKTEFTVASFVKKKHKTKKIIEIVVQHWEKKIKKLIFSVVLSHRVMLTVFRLPQHFFTCRKPGTYFCTVFSYIKISEGLNV